MTMEGAEKASPQEAGEGAAEGDKTPAGKSGKPGAQKRQRRREVELREARMRALVEQQLASMPAADPKASAQAAAALRRRRLRRTGMRVLLWVGVPVLLTCIYSLGLAQPEYESVAVLLVRGQGPEARVATLTAFLSSRELLESLDRQQQYSQHFAHSNDPWKRLPAGAGSEQRFSAFSERVHVEHADGSGIVKLRMSAFSPEQAQRFLQAAVREGDEAMARIYPHEEGLAVVARPSRPTEASYPKPAEQILSVAVLSLLLFGVGSMLISAAREHGQF